MILIVCIILVGFILNVISQDCGQRYFNGTQESQPDGGVIRMPELLYNGLLVSPNSPHTCTFIIRNLDEKGQVRLWFDDFLMYGGNATSASCDWPINQDQLKIFDGEDSKALPLFQACFTRHKRPPALMSSGNTMRLEYQHWSRFPGYPAFKAHYYFQSRLLSYWTSKPTDIPALFSSSTIETVTKYENGDSIFTSVLNIDVALDIVWLLVAPSVSHIFLSLDTIQLHGLTWDPSISLQINDGLTSDAQVVYKLSKISSFSAMTRSSSKNALYIRWRSQPYIAGSVTVSGIYVFYTDIVDGGDKCIGFACVTYGRCISSLYECDNINHCGDNGDENYCHACDDDFYCFNGGTCMPKSSGDYRCQCQRGYTGDHCEHDESSCPDIWCNNGGSCRIIPNLHNYACQCRHGFAGTQCQVDNTVCPEGYCQHGGTCYATTANEKKCICHSAFSGSTCQYTNQGCLDSYCQNGGTCKGSHEQYYCECPPGFQGMYCETTIVDYQEDNLASTLQYGLVIVVPSFVLLGLIWIVYRAKKGNCAWGTQRTRDSFARDSFSVSTDNPSSVSRTVSRMNSTSTASSYTDDPPPYHSVAGVSRRSRSQLLSHTSISLQPCVPEEPPPSYETVITSLESCQVRIIPQTNLTSTTHPLQETSMVGDCSLSQTSTTSEDCTCSSSSVTSNTSPSSDQHLPDVIFGGSGEGTSEGANPLEQNVPLLSNPKD